MDMLLTLLSGGVGVVMAQALLDAIKARRRKGSAEQNGLRILLYDRIKHLGKSYLRRGSISFEEREDLNAMHQVYHNELGGNGDLDALMKAVFELNLEE